MNILVVGHRYFVQALQAAGHSVISLGSMGKGHDIACNSPVSAVRLQHILLKRGFEPQVLFCCDDGNLPILYGQETLPWLSIFYSIDTYCNLWHIPLAHAYDFALAAQRDYARMFSDEGHAAQWFPLFYSHAGPEQNREEWLATRDIPISFVGTLQPRNIPERLPFLENFNKLRPLRFEQGEYTAVFRRSRIVLNQSAASELNFRLFEAAACGAAVLNDTDGQGFTELFSVGVDMLPVYPRLNARKAAALADFWLANPKGTARVALAGRRKVTTLHSVEARTQEFLRHCETLLQAQAPLQRLADIKRRQRLISTAYAILADDLPGTLPEHKKFYGHLAAQYLDM
ncbi:MAG: glycosyltransferase [Desulfovibrio sp.]|jgi:hypothetical protein|nr:glycosyltransferase [Desulfovibrio sp.]